VRFWKKFIEQLSLDEARGAFDSSALSPIMQFAQQALLAHVSLLKA
jgi:hypothetical protein